MKKIILLSIVLCILSFVFSSSVLAHTVYYACVTPGGPIKIVSACSACTKNETCISLAPLMTCSPGQVPVETTTGWKCGDLIPFPNAIGICVENSCMLNCLNGWDNCDTKTANGCETNLENDPANCGACGTACQIGGVCTNGVCGCPVGQTNCNGSCKNLQTDPANCGSCGTACPSGYFCTIGTCSITSCVIDLDCSSGYYCSFGNECILKNTNGMACTHANQCISGYCVDGVCCNTACSGLCLSCSASETSGGNGICGFVTAGTDPSGECPSGKTCNGSGSCY